MRTVIVGAGGHGAVVADILLEMKRAGQSIELVAFVDEGPTAVPLSILSVPVVPGGLAALVELPCDAAIVAVGDNGARRRICDELTRAGVRLAVARHPSSVVAADVEIGPGTAICAGAVINPSCRVGRGAIVNTHASVDHHNRIGDYVHVAPGVHLGGNVCVGDGALIGLGSVVTPQRRIGLGTIIGAGSVVVRDVPDGVLALGVPARVRRSIVPCRPRGLGKVSAPAIGSRRAQL